MPKFDRRNYIRYSVSGTINIQIKGDAQNIFKADLVDVSFLGLSGYLKKRIEIGTIVFFELTTRLLEKPLIGKGKVKSIQEVKRYDIYGFRTGIEFIDIDKKNILVFLNIIQKKISEEIKKMWRAKKPDFGPL